MSDDPAGFIDHLEIVHRIHGALEVERDVPVYEYVPEAREVLPRVGKPVVAKPGNEQ